MSTTNFKTNLRIPIPGLNSSAKSVVDLVGGVAFCSFAPCAVPKEAALLMRTEIVTTTADWDDFEIAGYKIKKSVWTGQGYWVKPGEQAVVSGLEWGTLENGDTYVSRWIEDMSAAGINGVWTLAYGSGEIAGITGEAKITATPPKQGDKFEACVLAGSYSLPD